MAYVHCHSCSWEQDDFYHEGYNPAKFLESWNEYLFGKKKDKLDEQFTNDKEFVANKGAITTREVIAREYEKFAKRIRKMKWITENDFRKDPNKLCPECGSEELDID